MTFGLVTPTGVTKHNGIESSFPLDWIGLIQYIVESDPKSERVRELTRLGVTESEELPV